MMSLCLNWQATYLWYLCSWTVSLLANVTTVSIPLCEILPKGWFASLLMHAMKCRIHLLCWPFRTPSFCFCFYLDVHHLNELMNYEHPYLIKYYPDLCRIQNLTPYIVFHVLLHYDTLIVCLFGFFLLHKAIGLDLLLVHVYWNRYHNFLL